MYVPTASSSLEEPFVRHDPRISSVGILKISQPSGEGFPGSKLVGLERKKPGSEEGRVINDYRGLGSSTLTLFLALSLSLFALLLL